MRFGHNAWFKQYFMCNYTSILQFKNSMVRDLTVSNRYYHENKKEAKDQESIQSSTTPDPGYQWESDNVTIRHHK